MAEVKEKKKLGVAEMAAYGIGNCIGSGIFVSMGVGIGYTGKSIPLALIIANIVVFSLILQIAYGGNVHHAGRKIQPDGPYTAAYIGRFFGDFAHFFRTRLCDVRPLGRRLCGNGFPQIEPYRNLIAVAIITLFFATTLLGGKFMGKFNMIMVVVLVISLIVYIAVGLPEVNLEAVRPTSDGYFKGGFMGLFMAIAVMSFACQGSTMPIDMTSDAKNPKRRFRRRLSFLRSLF